MLHGERPTTNRRLLDWLLLLLLLLRCAPAPRPPAGARGERVDRGTSQLEGRGGAAVNWRRDRGSGGRRWSTSSTAALWNIPAGFPCTLIPVICSCGRILRLPLHCFFWPLPSCFLGIGIPVVMFAAFARRDLDPNHHVTSQKAHTRRINMSGPTT